MFAFTAKKIKNTLAFGFIAFGLSTSVSSFAASTGQECKILVMGDSLSAAYGLPKEQGWVALMESRLAEKFPHCKVVNASVSGETTAGGKTRLPALLKQHKPSHMILELGANDGLRGLSLDTMKDNLTNMLVAARRSGAQAVLIGMQIPSNYGPAYARRFGDTFPEVARKQKVPLVPFMLEGFALDPTAFQADGIHPNAGAQPKILENIWPTFSATLK
ncbi:arylesterase [Limnobacter sp.]|jgi:acyl-CoA thioesterase-1|uniref:arylesterase n=1 Tax=Limnobacter sp. TaxID=2003368 RepID=UPI00311DF49B